MKETAIQKEIVEFLKQIGFSVYETSQGYRKDPGGTRMTAGIPDLYIIGLGHALWVEVKRPKGKGLSEAQEAFRDCCHTQGVAWALWRDVRDAWDWCVEIGVVVEA